MKNIGGRPRGKAITQESFGMEARDFACILLPAIDYNSQLQAIGVLLEQHRQNEQRSSERILKIERELPSLSGVLSHMANDERVDLLNMSVYADAAHSMAAIGQKRTVAVRQARSSEPVGQLVPAGRRETPVLAKAQAGRGDVVFIFANQGGFAPAFKCCLSQKSLVLQNVLIDHIGAMAR